MLKSSTFQVPFVNKKYYHPVLLETNTANVFKLSDEYDPRPWSYFVNNNPSKQLTMCIPDAAVNTDPLYNGYRSLTFTNKTTPNVRATTSYIQLRITKSAPPSSTPVYYFEAVRTYPFIMISPDHSTIIIGDVKSFTHVICEAFPTPDSAGSLSTNSEYNFSSSGIAGAAAYHRMWGAAANIAADSYSYSAVLAMYKPYNAATPDFITVTMQESLTNKFPTGTTYMLISIRTI